MQRKLNYLKNMKNKYQKFYHDTINDIKTIYMSNIHKTLKGFD